MDDLIGKIGQTNCAIEPGKRGEVLLPLDQGWEAYFAFADEPIAKNASVTVIGVLPAHAVKVAELTFRRVGEPTSKAPPPGSNLMNRP